MASRDRGLPTRPLGRTGLQVTSVCVGGSPRGSVPEIFGYDVSVDRAVSTVRRPLDGPVNCLDTAAIYSGGLERLGIDHIQLLYLHDPENISCADGMAPVGLGATLVQMQHEGSSGRSVSRRGPVDLMSQYIGTGAFDVLIIHNRWSLVDRSADGPTIVGVSRPECIDETVQLATMQTPDELWHELAALTADEEEWQW